MKKWCLFLALNADRPHDKAIKMKVKREKKPTRK